MNGLVHCLLIRRLVLTFLQRKRTDDSSELPKAKKAKKSEDATPGTAASAAKPKPHPKKPEDKPHKRRKLDIAPERGSKPTPAYKIANGKMMKDMDKTEKDAIEKRRWKRRALMRELGLWPPKGSPFPAVRIKWECERLWVSG